MARKARTVSEAIHAPAGEPLSWIAPDLRSLARPLAELKPDPKNARLHPEANLARIKASLRAHGQRKPIVVKDGVVVAGNGTLEIAKGLGWTHLACTEYDGPDALARAYAIADNASAELATWDDQVLAAALAEADGAGLLDATAFSRDDADAIVAEANRSKGGEDPGPGEPPAVAVSKPGEIYELGPHRILCGDSTDTEAVARLFGGERASLMATDPPYGVAYGVETGADGSDRFGAIANDENDGPKLQGFLERVFRSSLTVLREDAAWYLWHAQMTQGFFAAAAAAAAAAQVLIHRQIVWVKPSLILGHGDFHWRHELCFYGWRQGHRPRWFGDRAQTTVWEIPRENDNFHPTQKPVEIFARAMRLNTRPGEICFEPFAGSGTQIMAAAVEARRAFAVEIDPRYVDVIRRRWTGWAKSAKLDPGTGALE